MKLMILYLFTLTLAIIGASCGDIDAETDRTYRSCLDGSKQDCTMYLYLTDRSQAQLQRMTAEQIRELTTKRKEVREKLGAIERDKLDAMRSYSDAENK